MLYPVDNQISVFYFDTKTHDRLYLCYIDKKEITKEIGKAILLTIAISGVVILAATSPGFGYVLREIQKAKFKKYKNSRINQSFKRLKQQNLLSIKEENDKITIKLSDKGKKKVLAYKLEEMILKRADGMVNGE